jgi:hypothetical protein
MTALLSYGLPTVFIVLLCCYFAYRTGKTEGTAAEKSAADIKDKDAKVIEDRLRRDADFAKRVRQRFTR